MLIGGGVGPVVVVAAQDVPPSMCSASESLLLASLDDDDEDDDQKPADPTTAPLPSVDRHSKFATFSLQGAVRWLVAGTLAAEDSTIDRSASPIAFGCANSIMLESTSPEAKYSDHLGAAGRDDGDCWVSCLVVGVCPLPCC